MKRSPADSAFSDCIRASAGWGCERCGKQYGGKSTGLHCSHNFTRSHRTIRWCKENALSLCFSCHQWFGGNPADSGRWLEDKLGEETMGILREKMNNKVKVTKMEEKVIAKYYREQLKIVEAGGDLVSYQ